MAPKKNQKRQILNQLANQFGGGAFELLIDKAIRNGWDANQFLAQMVRTKEFRRRFPGLITGGRINDFLAGGADSITAGNLAAGIRRYKQTYEAYEDVIDARGYGFFKLNRQKFKLLLQGEKSPDEFGQELAVQDYLRKNPEAMAAFNAVLKAAGRATLDKVGFMRFLKNPKAQKDLYDFYEASRFVNSGLFNAEAALGLARNIGAPGQYANPDELVRQIKEDFAFVGPELQRQGITEADLATFLSNPGVDPHDIGKKYQQIKAQRQALSQQGISSPSSGRGPGGGLATKREQESLSY